MRFSIDSQFLHSVGDQVGAENIGSSETNSQLVSGGLTESPGATKKKFVAGQL